jgi:hypothetical protein
MSCRQVSERFGEAFCLDDLGAQRESLPSRIARRGVAKIWFKWLLWVQAVRKLRHPSQLGALAERTLLGSGWRTPSLARDPPGHPARGQGPRKKLPRQKAVIAREPQAAKQSRPGVGTVAPRLLRSARNGELCGIAGFMPCGSATPVAK